MDYARRTRRLQSMGLRHLRAVQRTLRQGVVGDAESAGAGSVTFTGRRANAIGERIDRHFRLASASRASASVCLTTVGLASTVRTKTSEVPCEKTCSSVVLGALNR